MLKDIGVMVAWISVIASSVIAGYLAEEDGRCSLRIFENEK
jgi:hypothetical protein